ncbi:hypothetical protein [Stenotrophomonas maltophilia]|uniref:hypothetical protein n=1 Tax=Stenotrophomonas maltophilia TaxID=40324 RepID=UPI0015F1C699|nr:hypothetical protein [Stenotrophomonas maltophilia]QDY49797.1 hypothetical protein DUW70_15275 [Stenotrophomonas maltophilia]
MSGWRSSGGATRGRVDLSAVPTTDLLREIERRCSVAGPPKADRPGKERPFATKALWAQDKVNQARARLADLRTLPEPDCEAERAARASQDSQLVADVVKYDGMAKVFARKGQ